MEEQSLSYLQKEEEKHFILGSKTLKDEWTFISLKD